MIDKLMRCTNTGHPVAVMDAAIATEENLATIKVKDTTTCV